MEVTTYGWRIAETDRLSCNCGTWKKHRLNNSGVPWPRECTVRGCTNDATVAAHITNPNVPGQKIVPVCESCSKLSGEFRLKAGATLVSPNKSKTCE